MNWIFKQFLNDRFLNAIFKYICYNFVNASVVFFILADIITVIMIGPKNCNCGGKDSISYFPVIFISSIAYAILAAIYFISFNDIDTERYYDNLMKEKK